VKILSNHRSPVASISLKLAQAEILKSVKCENY
jgi:hypothetical protein